MSFHFRWAFPLICDRSVWHIVKHPCTCQSKRAVKVRETTSTLLPYPILPRPAPFNLYFHLATLRYCHARHSAVLSLFVLLKRPFLSRNTLGRGIIPEYEVDYLIVASLLILSFSKSEFKCVYSGISFGLSEPSK